jgi:hypothetical protein
MRWWNETDDSCREPTPELTPHQIAKAKVRRDAGEALMSHSTTHLANQIANNANQVRVREPFQRIRDARCHPKLESYFRLLDSPTRNFAPDTSEHVDFKPRRKDWQELFGHLGNPWRRRKLHYTWSRSADLASEHLERRLTAILAADVAGYSRLTGLDEEGTHLQLREHLSSFVNPKIAEYRGRIVKNTGDGLLAEFSSAVDAVRLFGGANALRSRAGDPGEGARPRASRYGGSRASRYGVEP